MLIYLMDNMVLTMHLLSHGHSYLPLAGGTLTGNLNGTTASFSGKVDFQGDAAIEGGCGYGVFKGYTLNNNHFISIRGIVANSSTLSITGGHQTTFVEHAENNDTSGWFFKSNQTGSYAEIARITRTGGMHLQGNKVWHAGNDGSGSTLDADLLDGQHGSYYYSSANPPPTYAKYLRSDTSDSVTAGVTYTWGASDTTSLIVGRSSGGAEQIYIGGWATANSTDIHRIRASSNLHIDSAANGNLYLNYYRGGTTYIGGANQAWHAGNDGSGSGLRC